MSMNSIEDYDLNPDSSVQISLELGAGPRNSSPAIMAQADSVQTSQPSAASVAASAATSDPPPSSSTSATASAQNPKISRKRTKTGCLTCRKRRIKCGEERPICNNCVKSKRNCEGYTQRVVFKHPVGTFRTGLPMQDPNFPPHLQMPLGQGYPPPLPHSSGSGGVSQLLPIAPRPLHPSGQPFREGSIPSGYEGAEHIVSEGSQPTQLYGSQTGVQDVPAVYPTPAASFWAQMGDSQSLSHSMYTTQFGSQAQAFEISHSQLPQNVPFESETFQQAPHPVKRQSMPTLEATCAGRPNLFDAASARVEGAPHGQFQDWQRPYVPHTDSGFAPSLKEEQFHPDSYVKQEQDTYARRYSADAFLQNQNYPAHAQYPSQFPQQPMAFLDDPDDDYYDVESDEEMPSDPTTQTKNDDLRLILALNSSHNERQVRSFTTFLNEPNVLATYHPSYTASPLMDSKTARIFCHFVTSTGPSLSIFERHSINPAIMFTGLPVPPAQQALWTYTMPTVALGHQGLMHAMLALSSLHIAKLQNTSTGPSLKHYHYALRRVAKAVGLPTRRKEITTLAATLLLGFYEIMTAEHSKWNSHLAGAKQLVMEIDFAGMTRQIRRLVAVVKARLMSQSQNMWSDFGGYGYHQPQYLLGGPEDPFPDKDWAVDQGLISQLMGMHVQYDSEDDSPRRSYDPNITTMQDVERYRIRSDLYWWYCKQDVFQSMISGNRLLMPFEHWRHCPPRAQIGRIDAICGTMDHLVLLMARLSDFGGKDQKRKRRVVAANGGQWKPAPGFFPPGASDGPPAGPKPPSPAPQGPPPNMGAPSASPGAPPMYGMMPPPPAPPQMPAAFATMTANLADNGAPRQPAPPPSASPVDVDLETQTKEAETEWRSIRDAFDVFYNSLPSEFHPLPPDAAPPIQTTPFGTALQYRTHTIACIWTFYNVGRILVERMHPAMPPAAMVASGVAAHKTAKHAEIIGKICAGLFYPQQYDLNLNPGLGAALIESTFSLFFAAVQYTDPGQRGWTISKLRDIARRTGWQTSSAIAAGCEITWEKMGQAGRGPPYVPTFDRRSTDDRISGVGRRPENEPTDPLSANNDRRFISVNPNARTHWALGILSVDEDMKNLDLGK